MPFVRCAAALLAVLGLASCGSVEKSPTTPAPRPVSTTRPAARPKAARTPAARRTHVAVPQAGGVPVLSGSGLRSADVNDPPAVRQALARRAKQVLAQLRRAKNARPSAAAGCEPLQGPFQGSWGPPVPHYRARVLGHQVAVEFSFDRLPSSPACRPVAISAAVFSGQPGTSTYFALGGIADFRMVGRAGRFVVPLPFKSPPYHVGLYAVSLGGARSNQVVLPLSCEGRCLPPGRPDGGLPRPIFAPRGMTRAALARSVAEAVAHPGGFARATGVACSSLRVCEVAWNDPVERVRFSQRFLVAGERDPGCWLAQDLPIRGAAPRLAPAVGNPYYVGGCVHWPV